MIDFFSFMGNIDKVMESALKGVKPTSKEQKELDSTISYVVEKLESVLGKEVVVNVGGSTAKGTWLKGNADVDIFTRFDYYLFKDKDISRILKNRLSKIWKTFETLHGSRDYYQKKVKGIVFEIVPVLFINNSSKAENITDISPLHAEWVIRHDKYSDDVRLIKAFAKAQSFYGAESYLKGFSGYVLEILTIYYKGFKKLILAASKWKTGEIIDIEKHHKNVYSELNESKLHSPIIVIDPVQPGRNAAAALGVEKFNKFIDSAGEFIKNPSKDFFIKKPTRIEDLKNKARGKKLVLINAVPKEGKQDVVGSKLLKAYDHIRKHLIINEFMIEESNWYWDKKDKCLFWYILDNDKVSKYKKWIGPPVKNKEHASRFKQKYKNAEVKNGKLIAIIKRNYSNSQDLIKDLMKSNFIRDKVKKVTIR